MGQIVMMVLAICAIGRVLEAAPMQKMMDCSTMSPEMQEFASQMTPANKAIFCGRFTDGQRASAMEMASTEAATPDEAVQKVSGASGSNPQGKTPTGCPVK